MEQEGRVNMNEGRREERDDSIDQDFIFRCPECGAYSDDPDNLFDLNGFAPIPESDYILWECYCRSCKIKFDVAYLTYGTVVEQVEKASFGKSSQALLERYQNAVKQIAAIRGLEERAEDGRIIEIKALLEANLGFLNGAEIPNFERRVPIIPMEALAVARGVRMATLQSPGRILGCAIGPLNFVLSLVQVGEANSYYAVHLSISNGMTGDSLTNLQLGVALSLFFSIEECRHLREAPSPKLVNGVKHYFLPWAIG